MRKTFAIFAASLLTAVAMMSSANGQSADGARASTTNTHVRSVTAIGEVFGDGEKYTALAIEYDKAIDASKLSATAYSVSGRTIQKVYTNTAPARASKGVGGNYVVIELSADDATAGVYGGGPGRPGGPGGMGNRAMQGGPGGPGGPPDGQASGPRPPMGMGGAPGKPAKVSVAQVGDVVTATGEKYSGSAALFENDKTLQLVVDDFKQFAFKDPATGLSLPYNLFIPKNYDPKKSYPLVLFMHDASVTGAETTRTLTQGLGAVIWATPAEQAKHPALVLAPAFGAGFGTEGATGDASADTVVHLLNSVTSQYNVDKNRIYTTGQSFGCMLSLAIMIRYPDLFAASMLVAGQRDAQATSVLLHNRMWIIVAEGDTRAFPGMNDSVAVWKKDGVKVSEATWNARLSDAELTAEAKKMTAEGNNIKYATFLKGTVFPPGKEGGMEHMATWPVAYRITGVRDWLFAQSKGAAK